MNARKFVPTFTSATSHAHDKGGCAARRGCRAPENELRSLDLDLDPNQTKVG